MLRRLFERVDKDFGEVELAPYSKVEFAQAIREKEALLAQVKDDQERKQLEQELRFMRSLQ